MYDMDAASAPDGFSASLSYNPDVPRSFLCRLWPSHDVADPWQCVVRQLYGHLAGKRLLWTAAGGGQWLDSSQVLLPDSACWQQPEQEQQQQQDTSDGFGPLGHALVALGLPLAALPGSVLSMILKYLVSSCVGRLHCCFVPLWCLLCTQLLPTGHAGYHMPQHTCSCWCVVSAQWYSSVDCIAERLLAMSLCCRGEGQLAGCSDALCRLTFASTCWHCVLMHDVAAVRPKACAACCLASDWLLTAMPAMLLRSPQLLPLAATPITAPAAALYVLPSQPELPRHCTPAAARQAVKAHAGSTTLHGLSRQAQLVTLLTYCLADLDLSQGRHGAWQQQLQGLELLPLADGTKMAAFQMQQQGVYSASMAGPAGSAAAAAPVFVVTDALEQLLVGSQSKDSV